MESFAFFLVGYQKDVKGLARERYFRMLPEIDFIDRGYLLNHNFRPIYPKHHARLSINKTESIYVFLFFLKFPSLKIYHR